MHCVYDVPVSEICMLCAVPPATVERWQTGREPLPWMAYQLLMLRTLGRVPDHLGPWGGWRFVEERFVPPDGEFKHAPNIYELEFIEHYRLDRALCEKQADLIESLQRQLAFYKRQCGLEARVGLMVANLFGG
jgi:hypothetical protein